VWVKCRSGDESQEFGYGILYGDWGMPCTACTALEPQAESTVAGAGRAGTTQCNACT
jgi:hypothetical protein